MEDEEIDPLKDPFGTGTISARGYNEIARDADLRDLEVEFVVPETKPVQKDGYGSSVSPGDPRLTPWDYVANFSIGPLTEDVIQRARLEDERGGPNSPNAPVWDIPGYEPTGSDILKWADKYELPESFFSGLAQATSPDDLERRARQYSDAVLRDNRMAQEGSSFGGLMKQLSIGMLDPAFLAASGGLHVLAKGWQANTAFGVAIKGATLEGSAAALVEGAKFAYDPTQSWEEAAFSIVGSAVLGGAFEAAGHGVSTALVKQVDKQLAGRAAELAAARARRQELVDQGLIDDPNFGTLEAIVPPESLEPEVLPGSGSSVGAAQNPNVPVLRVSNGYDIDPEAPEQAGFGRWGTPLDRLARSPDPAVRKLASKLLWDPAGTFTQGVDAGAATRRIFEAGTLFAREARMAATDWARETGKAKRGLLNPMAQANTDQIEEFMTLVAQVHAGVRTSDNKHVMRAVKAYQDGYEDALNYLKNSSYNGKGSESMAGLSSEDFADIEHDPFYVMRRFSSPGWRRALATHGKERLALKLSTAIERANTDWLREKARKLVEDEMLAAGNPLPGQVVSKPPAQPAPTPQAATAEGAGAKAPEPVKPTASVKGYTDEELFGGKPPKTGMKEADAWYTAQKGGKESVDKYIDTLVDPENFTKGERTKILQAIFEAEGIEDVVPQSAENVRKRLKKMFNANRKAADAARGPSIEDTLDFSGSGGSAAPSNAPPDRIAMMKAAKAKIEAAKAAKAAQAGKPKSIMDDTDAFSARRGDYGVRAAYDEGGTDAVYARIKDLDAAALAKIIDDEGLTASVKKGTSAADLRKYIQVAVKEGQPRRSDPIGTLSKLPLDEDDISRMDAPTPAQAAPTPARAISEAELEDAVRARMSRIAQSIATKYISTVMRIMDPATKMVDLHAPMTREYREAAKDIIRKEFGDKVDFDDDIEEAIEMMLDLVAPVKDAAKDSNRARRRIKLDLKAGQDDDLLPIFDWNAEALYTTYRRQTAGIAGLLKVGFTSVRQLDSEINALRTGVEYPDEANRIRVAEDAKTLEMIKGAIMGTPPEWVASTHEDAIFASMLLRRYNFTRAMNNTGFLAFAEIMGSMVQMGPLRLLKSLPAYRKYIKDVRAGDPKAIESVMWIGDALMGHGSSQVRSRLNGFSDRQEDEALGPLLDRKTAKWRDRADRFTRKAANLTARTSGMAPITEWLRTSIAGMEAQAWVLKARKGKMPYSERRMRALGVSSEMWTRISDNLNKMGSVTSPDTGQARPYIDFSVWEDGEAANVFINALDRNSRRVVQEADTGHLPFWMSHPIGALMTQFLKYPMTAWSKQTRFAANVRDPRALMEALAMAIGGGMGHLARVGAVAMLVKSEGEERDEYLKKMTSEVEVAKSMLYYSAHGTLIPNLYDTGVQMYGGLTGAFTGPGGADLLEAVSFSNTRASGSPADLVGGNPSYKWLFKDIGGAVSGAAQGNLTKQDLEKLARTFAPMGNSLALLGAVNAIGSFLPPDEED